MDFEGIYKTLFEKFLKRNWQVEDGISEEDISIIEEKLSFKLPAAVREYYKTLGNANDLNQSHNYLTDLDELPHILFDFRSQPEALFNVDEDWKAKEDFLILMVENQLVVYWALKTNSIEQADPVIWQIVNDSSPEFHSEEKTFSEFIAEMFNWQFEN